MAVHRVIEAHAVSNGDAIAIADSGVMLSYRELNQRANTVARTLIDHGFRRGSLATVRMPRAPKTAIVLLGILKAGGGFVLVDEDTDIEWPRGVSMADTEREGDVRWRTVSLADALEQPSTSSANLPIISRATDVACVIPDRDGTPLVLVPHSTILTLADKPVPRFAKWTGEPGALDLWVALMAGATVTVPVAAVRLHQGSGGQAAA
jgi:surfactin family lipopeptide synthetase B